MSEKSKRFYRPDIDGLRAFAVVSVILYHLDATFITGGFVGVDVFFVISGYLITGLVRRKHFKSGFKYREFFVRRVRRLTPALLFLTVATCIAAYWLLLPGDLVSFAKSVIAQPIAMQNMHYMIEGEYFRGADSKALLHTWSLGVEEQFYFVWPFVIVFLSRLRRRPALAALAVILVGSFMLSLALPVISPKASFFLFPARTWELGIGGYLAIWEEGQPDDDRPPSALRTGAALLGVVMMLASFVWISEEMAFPGWVAILPVVATTLLIATGSRGDSPVRRALSLKPLVLIGLLSYPLYLWHWPVIVFARVAGWEISSPPIALVLVFGSTLMAWVSYRYVEQPVRTATVLRSTRSLLLTVGAIGAGLIVFGVLAIRTDGFANRYDEPARSMLTAAFDTPERNRCGLMFRLQHATEPACQLNQAPSEGSGLLIWGNSHAEMWATEVAALGDEHQTPVYLNARNCRATTDSAFCGEPVQQAMLRYVETHHIDSVLLASTWHGAYDIPDEEFEAELEEVVQALVERGASVWLLVDVPAHETFHPEQQYRDDPVAPELGRLPRAEFDATQRERERSLFTRLAQAYEGVHVLDATDAFCSDTYCQAGADGEVWYHDANHLTLTGARRAHDVLVPLFDPAVTP